MLITLDFESKGIEPRPKYPPDPVGLATLVEGKGIYYSWGHPGLNSCTEKTVKDLLHILFNNPEHHFVYHNAAFDCSIIEEKLDIEVPWERVHDTMLMAFLLDPYGELSLKPLAERYLNDPPTERDEVRDWLVRHGHCHANSKEWGAHISEAPASIVGPYAIADCRKTYGLYMKFVPMLQSRGML